MTYLKSNVLGRVDVLAGTRMKLLAPEFVICWAKLSSEKSESQVDMYLFLLLAENPVVNDEANGNLLRPLPRPPPMDSFSDEFAEEFEVDLRLMMEEGNRVSGTRSEEDEANATTEDFRGLLELVGLAAAAAAAEDELDAAARRRL